MEPVLEIVSVTSVDRGGDAKPVAIFWPYLFGNMKESWLQQSQWICVALIENGYTVMQHPGWSSPLPGAIPYDGRRHVDLAIYNHATRSEIVGDVIEADQEWFFKPIPPTPLHTTLDTMGYGPYSEPAYSGRPEMPDLTPDALWAYYSGPVAAWIGDRNSKWGAKAFHPELVPDRDYHLVLAQTLDDATVTRMSWGNYAQALVDLVAELARVDQEHRIIVKLHPYTDKKVEGQQAEEPSPAERLASILTAIDWRVSVYRGKASLHEFLPHARDVLLCNSGAGIEALMHHKPIISWGCPEYVTVTYDLRHLCDLKRALRIGDWYDAEAADRWLYWYTEQYAFCDIDGCRRRVAELLAKEQAKP